jgi:hypothetical protein
LLLSAGSQNANLAYVPLAITMFFHGCYLVVRSALRARCRPLDERELLLAATSLTLVIWLAYYFNFPAWWNLWIPLFLYGVVLALTVDIRRIRLYLAEPKRIVQHPWRLVAVAFVLMVCAISHVDFITFTRIHFAPDWRSKDNGVLVSGIVLPSKFSAPLIDKAAYLGRMKQEGTVNYSTLNSDFVPVMSHVYQAGRERDFWFMAGSDAEIRQTIARIADRRADRFLTDDQTGVLAVSGPRALFQERVRRIVSEYFVQVDRMAGWDIWVPRPR